MDADDDNGGRSCINNSSQPQWKTLNIDVNCE